MENIVKNFRAEIKSVNDEAKTVTAVISHSKKDRDGDIIPPDAFKKRLKRYKDHPVLLVNHDYRVENQIGEATNVKLNEDHVEATFKYYVGMGNATADWAYELAKAGMASYSIGFQAFGFDWIEEKDEQGNKRTTGRKFTEIELLEVSHVVIPANANALQLMIDDEKVSADEKELCGLVLKGIKDGIIKEAPKPEVPPIEEGTCIKGMAEEEFVKVIAEMKNSISQFQTQITEMSGRLLQLEQKVMTLENVENGEEIEANAEAQAGNDKEKHYSEEVLKLEDGEKTAGDGTDKSKRTPNDLELDVNLMVKEAFRRIN